MISAVRTALRTFAGAVALALVAAHPSAAQQPPETNEVIEQAVKEDFKAQRFDELEKRFEAYRSGRRRTPDGMWRLAPAYDALAAPAFLFDAPKTVQTVERAESVFAAWRKAYPFSKPAHLMTAQMLVNRAWLVRGDGYANTVKPDAWTEFFALEARARKALADVKAFAADDPHWYALMLQILKEASAPEEAFDAVADEALAREPTYQGTHAAILSANEPKWGGSWAKFDDIVDKLVARTAAIEGQSVYARAYRIVGLTTAGRGLFKTTLARWPRMKQASEDLMARYPSEANLNLHGVLACLAGDMETLRAQLERLGAARNARFWKELGPLNSCEYYANAARMEAEDAEHYSKPTVIPPEMTELWNFKTPVEDDFIAGRFETLDALHARLLERREMTSSGDWKLRNFYDALAPFRMSYAGDRRADDPDFDPVARRIDEWLTVNPKSTPALIARARTQWLKARALLQKFRSNPTPSAEAYGFLAKAREQLMAARDTAGGDPEWWATMLAVSAEDRVRYDAFLALAEEALSREPTYSGIVWTILDRTERDKTFAARYAHVVNMIVAASPPEIGPQVYAQSYLRIGSYFQIPTLIGRRHLDWPMMKRGLDQLVAAYPTDWNLNGYANFACITNDRPAAERALQRLEGRISEERWTNWRAVRVCTDWLKAEN